MVQGHAEAEVTHVAQATVTLPPSTAVPPPVRGAVAFTVKVFAVRRLVPMEVVATIFPFWSVLKSALVSPSHVVPSVVRVDDALAKVLRSEKLF